MSDVKAVYWRREQRMLSRLTLCLRNIVDIGESSRMIASNASFLCTRTVYSSDCLLKLTQSVQFYRQRMIADRLVRPSKHVRLLPPRSAFLSYTRTKNYALPNQVTVRMVQYQRAIRVKSKIKCEHV